MVQARRDLGNLEFKRTLRDFNLAALDAEIAVVFFAGHGIEINGINYLLPVDAKLKRDFDVEDEAVTLDRIIRAIEPAKKLRLIILDACRNNPFVKTVQHTAAVRSVVNGLGKVEPTVSDTLIAYAAKAGSYSDDGDGTNSPFTTALLKHLLEPGLDIRLALGRVRDEVLQNTHRQQGPFVYGSLGGASVSLVPAPPTPKPSLPEDMRADYELVERINTEAAWELFINTHKRGYYVELARERLRLLQDATAAKKKDEVAAKAQSEARAKAQRQEEEAGKSKVAEQIAIATPPATPASPKLKEPAAAATSSPPEQVPPPTTSTLLTPQPVPRPEEKGKADQTQGQPARDDPQNLLGPWKCHERNNKNSITCNSDLVLARYDGKYYWSHASDKCSDGLTGQIKSKYWIDNDQLYRLTYWTTNVKAWKYIKQLRVIHNNDKLIYSDTLNINGHTQRHTVICSKQRS